MSECAPPTPHAQVKSPTACNAHHTIRKSAKFVIRATRPSMGSVPVLHQPVRARRCPFVDCLDAQCETEMLRVEQVSTPTVRNAFLTTPTASTVLLAIRATRSANMGSASPPVRVGLCVCVYVCVCVCILCVCGCLSARI